MSIERRDKHFSESITISLAIVAVASLLATTLGVFVVSSMKDMMIFAQPGYPSEAGKYKFGTISSVQLDKTGKPEWILSGHWKSNLLNAISNSTASHGNLSFTPVFDASIKMVMVNGSALHSHTITNFDLSKISSPNNNTKQFNGTVTASLRNGPVTGIPVSIKFLGNDVISLWLDPMKIKNHYGSTPIFGLEANPSNRPMPPQGSVH
jgi:hypothetical protein